MNDRTAFDRFLQSDPQDVGCELVELDSNRNAIYRALFDARRKLRAVLVANGHVNNEGSRHP